MKIITYTTPPEGFAPQLQVAGCYLEVNGKLLLLQRPNGKSEPGLWGVPAGKMESGETIEETAKRELFEETGITASPFQHLGALYISKPEIDYVYHLFKVHLDKMPIVHLSNEHQDYTWATAKDLEELPLMAGATDALRKYRSCFPYIENSSLKNYKAEDSGTT